jgi:hypothetical protein
MPTFCGSRGVTWSARRISFWVSQCVNTVHVEMYHDRYNSWNMSAVTVTFRNASARTVFRRSVAEILDDCPPRSSRICYPNYMKFLRAHFSELLEDVSFGTRLRMRFQHAGALPRYSPEVPQWLSEIYLGRWNGRWREAPVSWPTRSPDLNIWNRVMSVQSILGRSCDCGVELNNLWVKYLAHL